MLSLLLLLLFLLLLLLWLLWLLLLFLCAFAGVAVAGFVVAAGVVGLLLSS